MSLADLFDAPAWGPAPEPAGPARDWIAGHGPGFGHFVGGAWRGGERLFDVFEPAAGTVLARAAQGGAEDVDAAVAAARGALPGWSALDGHARARVLYALSRAIQRNARLFAVLESLDNGKPIRESRDLDVPLAARHFLHHAGWATAIAREFPGAAPVGVCAQIVPWNFPLLMLSWKVAPALAAGNTVVLKPAEATPLTALLLAELCAEAGVPPGVVNVVTGDGATGRLLASHPGVDKIAFTGSTEVGREIVRANAGTARRLTMELGGKSPYVVFEGADLDGAVEGLVDAIFFNGGQVCCAGSRLLVQESVEAEFLARLRRRMARLRVGDPLDKAVDVGAIASPEQLARIARLVDDAEAGGATVERAACPLPERGWFYPPTLVTEAGPSSGIAREEVFGPVLVAMPFRTPEEAVALANNTAYGLAATVWCQGLATAHDVASRIKAGTVWINCANVFDAASGFGGYRESGFGREGGREGMLGYLRLPEGDAPSYPPAEPKGAAGVDRTHKLFVGGKQARADSGYSFRAPGVQAAAGEFARANRKDVRNAVEAANAAQPKWGAAGSAPLRAQILYYLAENLAGARAAFAEGDAEFDAAVRALFECAAWADKWDGRVHSVPMRAACLALVEPIGTVGIALPPHSGLLALVRSLGAALAMGNAAVVLASEAAPLAAAEMYRVIEASDVPAGVANLLTGPHADTLPTLAAHEGVEALWLLSEDPGAIEAARREAAASLKPVLVAGAGADLARLFEAGTQIKNVWIPYGA